MEAREIIGIVSEKYGVAGRVEDYGIAVKLIFTYKDRERVIGISRSLRRSLSEVGLGIMETAIERLIDDPKDIFLHYWYIGCDLNGKAYARGVVTGHPEAADTERIYTSEIIGMEIDKERGEAVLTTEDYVYRCPLRYCSFRKQDKYPDMLPDYEELKKEYKGRIELPEIEQGKALLVLSDFDPYYFHSLCIKKENGRELEYEGFAHTGMTQDSYLIQCCDPEIDGYGVDIRYFPHYRNIEFYSDDTEGRPLYAENIGMGDIYIRRDGLTFRLRPGERKELSEENAEDDIVGLPDGDLYPMGT